MLGPDSFLTRAIQSRTARVTFGVHTLLAIALCFMPLLDVLGFERAFITAMVACPFAAALGVSSMRLAVLRGSGPARAALEAAAIGLVCLLPTAAAGTLVELVRQPCDPGEGFLFLALAAGSSTLFGAALGALAATVARAKLVPGVLVAAALAVSVGWALVDLYTQPQIFVYSLPFGYWPGSLYDEEVSISTALVAHRALALLVAGIFVALAEILAHPRIRTFAIAAALSLGTLTLSAYGEQLGFSLDRSSIERVLNKRASAEGLELFVDPSVGPEELSRVLEDHRLRYQQLTRFFGGHPKEPIRSYVYRDVDQKRRLMGASWTQIARPWAGEIHIHEATVPHPVLKHELAHVFAAQIASGPFKVPASGGVLVNLGVVEGLAVAADWPVDAITVHGWARAMRALDLAPDPRRTLYPAGFWTQASSRAYTVAGSFIRFLIDERGGIERFAELYRTNSFDRAYGTSLDALATEWERFVDRLPLSKEDLLLAEHRFRQPSIFQKTCAHVTANLNERANALLAAGDVAGAIPLFEKVLSYNPARIDPLLAISKALMKAGDLEGARRFAARAAAIEGATEKSRAQAREAIADLDWRAGRIEDARTGYENVLSLHLSAGSDRLQLAKLRAITLPEREQAVLREVLLGDVTACRAAVRLGALARERPDDGLTRYLHGFRLEQVDAFEEGAAEMRAALALPLPGEPIAREARMALGRMLLRSGDRAAAKVHFTSVAQTSTSTVERLVALDWAERAGIEVDRMSLER